MLKTLVEQSRQHLNAFHDQLDQAKAEELVELLNNTEGTLFWTGMGKSGIVAKKIASEMTSANIRALYLSPSDAPHGDIGILKPNDIFLILSKSGESDELLHLVPLLRNKGVKLVAVVCKPGTRLARACDFEMVLPLEKELCPFDLMPTTSATIQMIFGDFLTVALMEKRQFSLNDYKSNHPAGQIGRRMLIKVKDLMLQGEAVPHAGEHDLLIDSLVTLSKKQSGCLLVTDKESRLLGIFTDGDLRRSLEKHGPGCLQMRLGELMTKSPRSVEHHLLAFNAMELMESNQKSPITVLPVLEGEKVVGLIRLHDIIQAGL